MFVTFFKPKRENYTALEIVLCLHFQTVFFSTICFIILSWIRRYFICNVKSLKPFIRLALVLVFILKLHVFCIHLTNLQHSVDTIFHAGIINLLTSAIRISFGSYVSNFSSFGIIYLCKMRQFSLSSTFKNFVSKKLIVLHRFRH